jgi:hypothetical protein
MLKNPNNGPNAVFVPRPDGSFRRFDGTTGRPMDHQKNGAPNGLYDQNGKLFFGAMPPDLVCDAMPSLWDKTADPKPPGSRDQDTGGSQKISRSSAQKAWAFAKDRLSPEDLEKLIEYLNGLVDPDLPDDAEDESGPVQFAGMPKPGGSMAVTRRTSQTQLTPPMLRCASMRNFRALGGWRTATPTTASPCRRPAKIVRRGLPWTARRVARSPPVTRSPANGRKL